MLSATEYYSYDLKLSIKDPRVETFPVRIAYKTAGSRSNPAVLLCSCFGGTLDDTTPFIYAEDGAFPASKYQILVVALIGNGQSQSPSNTDPPFHGPEFPQITYLDNITAQYALLQHLGVRRLFAYVGFSMGGQAAYHFAARYPAYVENVIGLCTSARTSWHNWCFLEGPRIALVNSEDFRDGHYEEQPRKGLDAFARVYTPWALSPAWFREECWREKGLNSLEEYIQANERHGLGAWDANNLLCLLGTWQKGDITTLHENDGNLAKALRRIEARCLIMPCDTDAYFPPADNVEEVALLLNAKLMVIRSIYGHLAGGAGGTAQDQRLINSEVKSFLDGA